MKPKNNNTPSTWVETFCFIAVIFIFMMALDLWKFLFEKLIIPILVNQIFIYIGALVFLIGILALALLAVRFFIYLIDNWNTKR